MLVMPAVKNGDAAPAGQRPNARSKVNQPHLDTPGGTPQQRRQNASQTARGFNGVGRIGAYRG